MPYPLFSGAILDENDPRSSVTNPLTGEVYTADTLSNDPAMVVKAAKKRLHDIIIDAMNKRERPAIMFFSRIIKRVKLINTHAAAIVWESTGARLDIDAVFILGASVDTLEWVLSHELLHITSAHATRMTAIFERYGVPVFVGGAIYGWITDLPVNELLMPFVDDCGIDKDSLITYDKVKIPKTLESIEEIYAYVFSNMDPDKLPKTVVVSSGSESGDESENGQGDGQSNTPGDSQDSPGSRTNANNDGTEKDKPDGKGSPTFSAPSRASTEKSEKNLAVIAGEVARSVDSRNKGIGSLASVVLKHIEFLSTMGTNQMANNVLQLLETCLRNTSRNSRSRVRSVRRISRLTGLPPGRIKPPSYSVMFYVDESGSMSDWEVGAAFELVRKTSMSRNSDKLFVCHWDTEPCNDIETVRSRHDVHKLNRKKAGGTVFSDMFSHKMVMSYKADARVIVTDGQVWEWPKEKSLEPVIWIITTDSGYEMWKSRYNKGMAFNVSGRLKEEAE